MSIKKVIKIGLFVFLAVSILFPVSCKKRMPESPVDTGQEASTVTKATETVPDIAPVVAPTMEEENLASAARAAQQVAAAHEGFSAKKIYFDFDDATLSNDAIGVLTDQARWLRLNSGVSIIIQGYCDERGTDEYNLALGARRAESAKAFLAKAGIGQDRMMTISYGEERPADPGHNEDAWSKNRRVEFVIR